MGIQFTANTLVLSCTWLEVKASHDLGKPQAWLMGDVNPSAMESWPAMMKR